MEYPPTKPHLIALHELRKNVVYDKYKESFQHVLDLAGNDVIAQLEVYQYYCSGYIITGNLEDAKEMIRMARNVTAPEIPIHKSIILLTEALYNCTQRETALSESQVEQALALIDDRSSELYFIALNIRVNNYLDSNNFEEGIRLCRETIESAHSNLLVAHRNAYNNLGMVYQMLERYEEAEFNYQEALKLSEQLEYKQYIASAYGNLASLAISQITGMDPNEKHIAASIKYGLLALETANQTSDTYFKAITLGNLGLSYSYINLPIAIQYAQEALSLARTINVNYLIGSTLLWLAEILERGSQYRESLTLLEECIGHFEFLPENSQVHLYRYLSRVCNNLSLYEKGFQYSQMYVELLMRFHTKAKEGDAYHNKVLLEMQHQHEQELHELQLRSIQDKMQTQAAQLVSQTELLSKFRDELREIAQQHPSSDPGWRAVKEKLKELPCKSIDWEKFEAEFAAVHPEFTRKLNERYPTLTPMEVKLCSLLRLNLKSHEIGRLFCIAERGIETHRFNIRKKMGLEREQNLVTFLNSL